MSEREDEGYGIYWQEMGKPLHARPTRTPGAACLLMNFRVRIDLEQKLDLDLDLDLSFVAFDVYSAQNQKQTGHGWS